MGAKIHARHAREAAQKAARPRLAVFVFRSVLDDVQDKLAFLAVDPLALFLDLHHANGSA